MNDIVKNDILAILVKAQESIRSRDMTSLQDLSNRTIHNASIFQDKESVTIAVVIYSLSKIEGRMNDMADKIVVRLGRAIEYLEEDDEVSYEKEISALVLDIKKIDRKMDLYIQHIINRAQIKKGSKIYEHGISLGKTAEILGITQWELIRYLGQTKIPDSFADQTDVLERIRFARRLFR